MCLLRDDVVARSDLLDPSAHIPLECFRGGIAFLIGRAGQVALILDHRCLDVHVQQLTLNEEREVRPRRTARHLLLLAILNALDESRETEHVLSHTLPPLAPRLTP